MIEEVNIPALMISMVSFDLEDVSHAPGFLGLAVSCRVVHAEELQTPWPRGRV